MALPWVEKYRPKSVDEVSHQGDVIGSLRKAIEEKNLPHLIFYGPPGTGKTSTILAAARELFGKDYRSRVMELNASDERGIAVVRNKIKSFAQVAVSSQTERSGVDAPPPYKLIVLDEADSMTTDAQSALRRTMETYSKVTRFCIICNYISRLIPPIASRCAKFRFKALPAEAMIERLRFISDQEGVEIAPEGLVELMRLSEGDMRRAIQMLQSLHQLHGGIQQGSLERYVWPVHLPGWLALGWRVAGPSPMAAEPLPQTLAAPPVPLELEPEPTAGQGKRGRGRRRKEEEPQPAAAVEPQPTPTGADVEPQTDADPDPQIATDLAAETAAEPGDDSTAEGALALSSLPDDLFSDPLI